VLEYCCDMIHDDINAENLKVSSLK